ncbi:Immunoglobulin-like domain,Immunoglobulin-like fold [Cinara cedri]|uniref:Immunoglobulin-like domain,Immunoglobulin-like fold n=1 Tax=Cinara cedri TaxID=506608 RepID=A0A5E4M6E2_9HEMI|nr:Immunoglobulin-like domain,Immunoglobulin-like fold [Cinara cedri]
MEHDKLYSVKWYKDDNEFYRFVPENQPANQFFHQPGIVLDFSHCNRGKIILSNVTLQTSGEYRCEVSTDGPKFEIVSKSANMTVLTYPEENPLIEGVLNRYAIGDLVSGNCTSSLSNPQPLMKWYVNGIQATNNQVLNYPVLISPEGPLYSKAVGIQFKIEKNHFQEPEQELDLICEASLIQGQLKWRKMIVIQLIQQSYTENMFLEDYNNNINTTKPGKQVPTIIALLVVSFTHIIVHKT